jgi:low temperature requirement protein LtrA
MVVILIFEMKQIQNQISHVLEMTGKPFVLEQMMLIYMHLFM